MSRNLRRYNVVYFKTELSIFFLFKMHDSKANDRQKYELDPVDGPVVALTVCGFLDGHHVHAVRFFLAAYLSFDGNNHAQSP